MHSRITYSLAVLLFCLGSTARADQPQLTPKGGTGFPAISQDRKTIAVVDFQSWYDDTLRFALLLFSTASPDKVQTISIWDGPGDQLAASKTAAEALKKANSIITEQPFTSLTALKIEAAGPDQQTVVKTATLAATFEKSLLKVTTQQKKSFEAKLPTAKKAGWCCGAEDPTKTCDAAPELYSLWTDAKEEFLLIGFGYFSGPDGCERGPAYKLLKFN